jgi:hypothetical protein
MPRITIYLARAIGLFTLLMVAAMAWRGNEVMEPLIADTPVMFTLAMISVGLGVAMVLGHNNWSGGLLAAIVTLTGWLVLLKGVMLLFLSPDAVPGLLKTMDYRDNHLLYLVPALLLGLYLTAAGFMTRQAD